MKQRLQSTSRGDCVDFRLVNADGSAVPLAEWSTVEAIGSLAGTAVLASLEQSGIASLSDDARTLTIGIERLVTLDDERARAIGLPAPVPFILQIDSRGALGQMRLEARWLDSDGLRVSNVRIDGIFLEAADATFLLASPFFEITSAITAFNERSNTDAKEQASAWADIQELIGVERTQIHKGRVLDRLRVARATRFSLDFVPDENGGFQIAPVPLSAAKVPRRKNPTDLEDASPEGPAPAVPILSGAEQARFQRAFRAREDAQTAYIGGDGVYVLLSPAVQRSLHVVRRMQDRPPDERLGFARNPFPELRAHGLDDEEPPFVESRSFSDRVIGLGLLEKVVLPWQILSSQGWLPPDTVPVRLGGADVPFTPAAIDPAIVDLERAISLGDETLTIEGHHVPAEAASRDAFLEARKFLDERASSEAAEPPKDPLKAKHSTERVGLQIARNNDQVAYASRRAERAEVSLDLPQIHTVLKAHQTEAVSWLQRRWSNGHRGALLADDMGLGKTLSALTFMMWLRQLMLAGAVAPKPMLIVAPLSLLENWCAEHDHHIAQNKVAFVDIIKAYGSTLPRRHAGRDIQTGATTLDLDRLQVDRFGKPTCVLTTYETLRDYQQSFAAVHFALVVLDEAQRIKNPASLSWHAVSALHSDFWLALTGTPVENRLADLWAIADAIEPNFLGSLKDFSATYEGDVDEPLLRTLKGTLEESTDEAPFMLRRLKADVLDGLPLKLEYIRPRTMPLVQETAYDSVIEAASSIRTRGQMLAIIQQLREISLHPLRPSDVDAETYLTSSARFQSLLEILDDVSAAGEKALVFLDRNIVEAYLARLIQQRYSLPRLPSIINGEIEGKRRKRLVDEFQDRSGFDVMLLSPKAGGVGLTLTAANHVIHLSRWWNPAVEDQSTDRAYRIGQHKTVHVYYLQATLSGRASQSFDERLHLLLQKKRGLSRDLLRPYRSEQGDAEALLGTKTLATI